MVPQIDARPPGRRRRPESPGNSIVRVVSEGGTFYDLGDLYHLECEVERQDWAPWSVDLAAAMDTRRRVVAEALAADALCTFRHAPAPGFGRFVGTADRPRWSRDFGS